MPKPSETRIGLVLFFAFFLTYAYFFQGGGWNQNARFDQVRAIVEHGTLAIDAFIEEEPNTADVALFRGHYYPNKPPGLSLLGVPVYAVLVLGEVLAGLNPWGSVVLLHWNAHLVTALTVSALSAGLMAIFFVCLRHLKPSPVGGRFLVTLGLGLGTLAFPWSTQFQAHQASAALTFAVFAIFLRQDYETAENRHGKERKLPQCLDADFLAGLCAGVAVLVAYNNVPVVALLLGYRLLGPRPLRGISRFCLGASAPVAGLLAYHWVCFGSPFATSYTHENRFFLTDRGEVLGLPSLSVFLEVTVKPKRGLFYSSPFLLAALPGMFFFLWQGSGRVPEAAVCLGAVLFYFLLNASFIEWHGGSCAGPRYLIPCLPFLAAAVHFLTPMFRRSLLVIVPLSIFIQTSVTAVNPNTPQKIARPAGHCVESFLNGYLSTNTQSFLEGFPPDHLGLPLEPRHEWSSYNLGEVIGLDGATSLLPLLLLWMGVVFWLLRRSTRRSRDPA